MYRSILCLLAVIALVTGTAAAGDPPQPGSVLSGHCAGVVDGDTLLVKTDAGKLEIDLAGVDAPEMDQSWGREVREFMRSMTRRCELEITVVAVDGDAVTARVTANGQDLSQLLAVRGLAWVTGDGPDAGELQRLSQSAKDHPCGLWTDESPQPPWEHRQQAA